MSAPDTRLRRRMAELARSRRPALVVYLTQGDPSPEASIDLCERVAAAGADVIELGVPFSDPNADGVVIQAAMQRALAAGGGLAGALDGVRALRARGCEVPIVLFGYFNPIFVLGVDRFAGAAAAAGVDAVLTVDLPIDELDELSAPLARAGVDVVPLVAPTTGADRLTALARLDVPFVYYISMTGVTGASFQGATTAERVAQVRQAARAPVAVGFGIKTATDAAAVARVADGVVVGSAVIERIASARSPSAACDAVHGFVAELRLALDGTVLA
ncbi:MAG TPA: tryptophan synthase subunit alpha [Kofleriaceae bacterium]|nr:tryptophan synthase subunit alpha [Kofleriaceae bacterium]